MRSLIRLLTLITSFVIVSSVFVFAGSSGITVKLDGVFLDSDTPAVIVEGRTMVPARAIFEAMGGIVDWNSDARQVTVIIDSTEVKLKIDSKRVTVNKQERQIDVPALIIDGRVMVPIRFISESVGCSVTWDAKTKVVGIESPKETQVESIKIREINLKKTDSKYIVEVSSDSIIAGYKDFAMNDPDRFVVDISGSVLSTSQSQIEGDGIGLKGIRLSQYQPNVVRVVVDVMEAMSGTITTSADKKKLFVTFNIKEGGGVVVVVPPDANLPILNTDASEKLVFLDPGHGGSDPGSIGYQNGIQVLKEKDINLEISKKLNTLLVNAGVKTYLLRTTDETIQLHARQDKANQLKASLYVAIHNNCFSSSIAKGTEVLYSSSLSGTQDGISSKELAGIAQKEMIAALGRQDRGTKTNPELAVLRRTSMPAIIVEGAFLSNPDDLELMLTKGYSGNYAMAIARAIISELNNSL